MSRLRIGVPSKGRLAEAACELLGDAGLRFRRQERGLFARVQDVELDVIFLRTDDIPVLCAEGAIDLGVTGSDLLAEAAAASRVRLELGMGACRLALCVPEESRAEAVADLAGLRVATSFPNVTGQFLAERGVEVHLVTLSGSVEVATGLGVADAVVDVVETGSTLAANRLRILAEIGRYEAVLIQAPELANPALADRIVRRVEGVVIARSYTLLEYNVPRERLGEAEAITPGFDSPTVNPLEDPQWCAVRVMVPRAEVIEAMEKLEALGASAILETPITNCRL